MWFGGGVREYDVFLTFACWLGDINVLAEASLCIENHTLTTQDSMLAFRYDITLIKSCKRLLVTQQLYVRSGI